MSNLLSDPSFRVYAVCCIALCLILSFLSGYTGATRARTKSFGNPEDAKRDPKEAMPVEHPDVLRVLRCHRNALENIPMFFALGLVYVLAGASPTGATVCFLGFTIARLFHVVFHLKAIAVARSMSYGVAALALVGMMVLIAIKVAGA